MCFPQFANTQLNGVAGKQRETHLHILGATAMPSLSSISGNGKRLRGSWRPMRVKPLGMVILVAAAGAFVWSLHATAPSKRPSNTRRGRGAYTRVGAQEELRLAHRIVVGVGGGSGVSRDDGDEAAGSGSAFSSSTTAALLDAAGAARSEGDASSPASVVDVGTITATAADSRLDHQRRRLRPLVAVYFTGQARSLNRTICSIRRRVFAPLIRQGFTPVVFIVGESDANEAGSGTAVTPERAEAIVGYRV